MNVMPLVVLGMVPGEGKPESGKNPAATPNVVDILIEYAGDGSPSAHPDPAYVRKGGTITWHTEVGNEEPFEILAGGRLHRAAEIVARGEAVHVLGIVGAYAAPERVRADHNLRPSDTYVVGQHGLGCTSRTLRVFAERRPE